jgi:hypothetical protein
MRLFYGDFCGRQTVDVIETEYDATGQVLIPRRPLNALAPSLPMLGEHFPTHRAFSEASLEAVLAVLGPQIGEVSVTTLETTLLLNRGTQFVARPLPPQAQWAPAFSVNTADFDGDGNEDVFLSQNFFATRPETPRLDAGRGLLLRGDGQGGFLPVPGQNSGILVYGEQRGAAVADFNQDGRADLLVTQNGAATKLYQNATARPGLRLRLAGPTGNPSGIGALLRLNFGDRLGPVREIHAGSGYLSQDSAIQVMATPAPPSSVVVRWPGGRVTTTEIPAGSAEIALDQAGTRLAARP